MRKLFKILCPALIGSFLISGCATIVGGSKYNAHIEIRNRPNANILYNGEIKGKGHASFKVKRNEANRFSLTIREDGWQDQRVDYTTKTFRGGAFVGTILLWTGLVNGFPIPWGVIVDLATGAVWKPNVHEQGIIKEDYKNFRYMIDLPDSEPTITSLNNLYNDLVYLKNGKIVRGVIIENVPDVHIKLQNKDGNIFVIKMVEIERITKEEAKF